MLRVDEGKFNEKASSNAKIKKKSFKFWKDVYNIVERFSKTIRIWIIYSFQKIGCYESYILKKKQWHKPIDFVVEFHKGGR